MVAPRPTATTLTADQQESRFRMTAAWLLWCATLLGMLGATWDIQWHASVGPDSFFTPSHGMLYFSRALSGLLALYVVIRTTRRYRQGAPGVTDATTTAWFKVLRAPVGFIVAGLGVLSFVLGGLYDLWWHTLYGFDVTLLSPSHFSLAFGTVVVSLGMMYVFASEANRQAARGDRAQVLGYGWLDLGFALAAADLMMDLGTFTEPALHEVPFAGSILVYPAAISLVICLGLFIAISFLRRPGAATFTAVIFTLLRLIGYYWGPFMVNWERTLDGLPWKVHGLYAPVVALSLPAYLIAAAIVMDVALYLGRHFGWYHRLTTALAAALGVAVNFWLDPRWIAWLHMVGTADGSSPAQMLARMQASALPSLVVAVVVGVLVSWFAWGVGNVLRYTDK